MDLLVLGDHHNDLENSITYLEKIGELKFDCILYTGDFSDVNPTKGFSQKDIAKIILEELKMFKKPVFAVPGNNDDWGVLDILEKEKVSVHGKGRVFGDYGIYGFGGAKTPFNTSIEPSEEEMKSGLVKGFNDVKNVKYKIQLTHNPPKKTKVDLIKSGVNVGSEIVRSFIEDNNPILAVSGHIHESKGVDVLKGTFLINPGRFSEGYFGMVNITDGVTSGRVFDLTY